MRAEGLVDVAAVEPGLRLDVKYATTDNFLGVNVYGDLTRCFLRAEVAERLRAAQQALVKRRPGWSLLLHDCARPRRVQTLMWQRVRNTPNRAYVASPGAGSIHNFGAAVDLSLTDADGSAVDMGTPYDSFEELAQPRFEARFAAEGKLSAEQLANRRLLREVMVKAGFRSIPNEWWHFDAFSRAEAAKRYRIIE